jgi:hypothetical protein
MVGNGEDEENKFTKSRRNQGVQRTGRELLLLDRRFQDVSLATKKRIIELIGHGRGFGTSSFDLIMKPLECAAVTEENVAELWPKLRLVEMKATKKPIQDAALNRFFFGATQNEIRLAEALGDRLLFAFVVLSTNNVFGRPFARLLTLPELRERTKSCRTQFQVNFRSDMSGEGLVADGTMILVLDQPDSAPRPAD